jgi:hypothetical protein
MAITLPSNSLNILATCNEQVYAGYYVNIGCFAPVFSVVPVCTCPSIGSSSSGAGAGKVCL